MTILTKRLLNGKPVLLNLSASDGTTQPSAVQSFSLTNQGASSSLGLFKRGVWFKKGEIPAGSIPTLSGGTGQLFATRAWNDGSLKTARLLLRDTTFAVGASRTYTIASA